MNLIHQAKPPAKTKGRHIVTKANAILAWDLRYPDATPEKRALVMKQINYRYKGRS